MHRVRVCIPYREIDITKSMVAPKKYTDEQAWLAQARKYVPQIPSLGVSRHLWSVKDTIITTETIVFVLSHNTTKDQASVVIDRKSTFGRN